MKSSRKKSLGTTLVEMMVYMSLMGVVFSGVYGVFTYSMRFFRIADVSTQMQQEALNSISKINYELTESDINKIIIDTNGIIFPSPRKSDDAGYEFESTGAIKWQKWVCYYLEARSGGGYNLMKVEEDISSPSASPGTCPYTSTSAFASAVSYHRPIARNVSAMTFSKSGSVLNLTLEIDKTTDTTKPNKLEVKTEIRPRN